MQAGRKVIPFTPQNFRRFVVGSMLQTLKLPSSPASPIADVWKSGSTPATAISAEPGREGATGALLSHPPQGGNADSTTSNASGAALSSSALSSSSLAVEEALTSLQFNLSKRWSIEHKPFDGASTKMFYKRLTEFSIGAKPLPTEVLDILDETFSANESKLVVSKLLGGEREAVVDGASQQQQQRSAEIDATTSAGMRTLLELCDFVKKGDNPHRLVSQSEIELPEAVHKFVDDHVAPEDPFDELRVTHTHNVFAIDSITTSEVDDAIGIRTDESGNEIITVYVADATVHCPIYSELEQFSARRLTTTSYLPEGVFFMLPTPIIRAATLSPDRPSRTFNINFRIDKETGEVFDYSIEVGWATALRRVTYDQVQEMLETNATAPIASSPSWLSVDDVSVLRRINEIAVLRYKMREKRSKGFTGSMPDPLVIVKDNDVVDVRDEIICTKDARLAVAELMIAANEVCSRVAQASKVSMPFRGSRPLSTQHEAVAGGELVPPLGYSPLPSKDPTVSFFARTVMAHMEKIRGVTRAYYTHQPCHHNGLDTFHYCHATSPLRRYPDMLVHHQLKSLLARQRNKNNLQDMVPEFEMVNLCQHCSKVQGDNKLTQLKSDRFWVLRFVQKQFLAHERRRAGDRSSSSASNDEKFLLRCFVGATEYLRSCPDAALNRRYSFRSDVWIPDIQIVHHVYHDRADMLVGVTAMCSVSEVDPYLGKLTLVVESVSYESDVQETLSKMVTLIADA